MSAELLERSHSISTTNESPLSIIDAYRKEFEDRTTLSPIDMEFPYLDLKDRDNIHVLETGANRAGAFKWRGALMGAIALQHAGHDTLVVPSAGNHARGAVLAARVLDMSIDVVVPSTAPLAKREGLRGLWADAKNRVHVAGATFDESLEHAHNLIRERGGSLLHPYDDVEVVAGQGTIVDDLLRTAPDVDHIVLPVGGGGLLAGVTNRLRALRREDVQVTAVQAPGSNSLSRSLEQRRIASAEAPNQAYGGSAVKRIGAQALESTLSYPNLNVVTADQEDISYVIDTYEQSRNDLMRTDRYFVPAYEPTSLVAIAGLYKVVAGHGVTVVVGTGHNAPLHN